MANTRMLYHTVEDGNGQPRADYTIHFQLTPAAYKAHASLPESVVTVTTNSAGYFETPLETGVEYKVLMYDSFVQQGTTIKYGNRNILTIVVPHGTEPIDLPTVIALDTEPDPDPDLGELANVHMGRTDNPHAVTAAQTGAYTTGEVDGLLDAKADTSALGSAAYTDATAYATAAQGETADTAVQPDDLAAVATSGALADLDTSVTGTELDALKQAADQHGDIVTHDADEFATAAQGGKADTALQPDALTPYETSTQLNSRDTANRSRANHTGTQAISTVEGLEDALDAKLATDDADVGANTAARHTHDNKALLDGIPTGGAWYQVLRRGTAGPEWVEPAGTVVPTLLVPMQGTLDGWDRSGAITVEGVGALRFRDGGALVEEAGANYVQNPRFASNATGIFASGGGTFSRIEDDGVTGSTSLEVSGSETYAGAQYSSVEGVVYPGDGPVTVSFARKLASGASDWRCYGVYLRADGTSIPSAFHIGNFTPTASWSRVAISFTAAPAETAAYMALQFVRGSDAAGTIRVTDVQVEQGDTATTYIDGALGPGYAWTGTAHASDSTRAETSIVIPAASFPASLAIRYSEDMGQTWQLATLDDEGAFGNYGVVTYANGDLTFGVSERNVIIGGVRGDERALTDGEKASLLASPVWTWGGLAEGQQGPYTHPATILGTFPPNAQAAVGGATLRTAPGTTAPTIDTLTEGTEVHDTGQRITESATDYAYVLTAVGQGYVDESDITGL